MANERCCLPSKIQTQEFGALWLANLLEKEIDIAGLIDSEILPEKDGKGPSVGEYFLYAIYNRMIGGAVTPDFKTTTLSGTCIPKMV